MLVLLFFGGGLQCDDSHPSTLHALSLNFSSYSEWLWVGRPDDWSSIPDGGWESFPHHRVQTGPEAHPASYPMSTRWSFLVSKATGTRSWPLTSKLMPRLNNA